jgi:ubiquinol-cytochrome c reductase cytochrome b subunit
MEAAKRKAAGETRKSISLPENWTWILIVVLLIFQVYLNLSAYYAATAGFRNVELFLVGLVLITFAGIFHIYRYANQQAKIPKPAPPKAPAPTREVVVKPVMQPAAVAEVAQKPVPQTRVVNPSTSVPSSIGPASGSIDSQTMADSRHQKNNF